MKSVKMAPSPGIKRLGVKVTTPNKWPGKENVDLYIHFSIRLYGIVLN
jgi:hypothetical protein